MLPAGKRVYIAGCGGMLGRAVYAEFARDCVVKATDIDLNIHWLEHADVRDLAGFDASVTAFTPDILINLSALTDLEYCERNAENSWLTNALGAENAAIIARRLDIPLVQISTAGIVDGAQDVYNDFEQAESARYLCEVEVLRRGRRSAPLPEVLRVSSRLDDGRRTCEGQESSSTRSSSRSPRALRSSKSSATSSARRRIPFRSRAASVSWRARISMGSTTKCARATARVTTLPSNSCGSSGSKTE